MAGHLVELGHEIVGKLTCADAHRHGVAASECCASYIDEWLVRLPSGVGRARFMPLDAQIFNPTGSASAQQTAGA